MINPDFIARGDCMTANDDRSSGLSRRDFLKISSIAASVPLVAGPKVIEVAGQEVAVHGPGAVPVTLKVNGKRFNAELEPRVTLLDALREHFEVTGPKRVCDRAECGACTVAIGDQPGTSATIPAIADALGRGPPRMLAHSAHAVGGGPQLRLDPT